MKKLSSAKELLLADLTRANVSGTLIARVLGCSTSCVYQIQARYGLQKKRRSPDDALPEIDALLAANISVKRIAEMTDIAEPEIRERKKQLAEQKKSSSETTTVLVNALRAALGAGAMPPDDVLLKTLCEEFQRRASEAIASARMLGASPSSAVH